MIERDVVIGLGYGDEGKGRTVDFLAKEALKKNEFLDGIVVRFSGGHQAGHMVHLDENINHVFTNFGSASFRNYATYWSHFCTFEPIGFLNEYNALKKLGFDPIRSGFFIHPDCPVTTPLEIHYGIRRDADLKHGSCGVGFFTTLEREKRGYHIKVRDLFYPDILVKKLELLKSHYYCNFEPIESIFNEFLETAKKIVKDGLLYLTNEKVVEDFDHVIYEGSQGLLLDQEYGFFPHCTPSNTGLKNVAELTDIHSCNVYYVTRGYLTRHGNGPCDVNPLGELGVRANHIIKNDKEVNEAPDLFQGVFRKRILDASLLDYAAHCVDFFPVRWKTLVVTCMDLMQEYILVNGEKIRKFETKEEFVDYLQEYLSMNARIIFSNPIN